MPVIDDGGEPRALPAVEIRPDGGVYDYTARYTAGATEFIVPARLDTGVAAGVRRRRRSGPPSLGLRDLSRCDLIIDADGEIWFLEVNVAPGMTETSLVPLSVEAAGLDLGKVFVDLSIAAAARHRHRPPDPRCGSRIPAHWVDRAFGGHDANTLVNSHCIFSFERLAFDRSFVKEGRAWRCTRRRASSAARSQGPRASAPVGTARSVDGIADH